MLKNDWLWVEVIILLLHGTLEQVPGLLELRFRFLGSVGGLFDLL